MFSLNNILPSKIKSTSNSDSRKRFRISAYQVQSLEDVFKNNPRPCKEIQEEVATQLNLPYRTVTIWFQNRRAKAKLIGEPIADHVFQWKPPVIATKSPSTGSGSTKQGDSESMKSESTPRPSQLISQTTSHSNVTNEPPISPGLPQSQSQPSAASHFSNHPPATTSTNFHPQTGWVPDSAFNNPEWHQSQQPSFPPNSMDSASFMSDFTNYEGCNFQVDFDNFLASQGTLDTSQLALANPTMMTSPEGFNPQQLLAYPTGIFTPPLSQSVLSLSTQNTVSSGYYNDAGSTASLGQVPGGLYTHPNGLSVQSLPHFQNGNGSVPHSVTLANSLGLQHPTQSAPELAFRQPMPPPSQASTPYNAQKLQQQRNNAMFFSMRS